MAEDRFIDRMCGEIFNYDDLKSVSQREFDELNELRGATYSFDDFLTEFVDTGTFEMLADGVEHV